MNANLTRKSFDTGEVTLNYVESPASGEPLVLLHGGTRSWQDWQALIPTLSADWHTYAPDLRGHGKSGRAAGHYHLNNFTSDIVAFIGDIVKRPAVIAGHSLGAATALGTAAQMPDQVRGLILLDPPLILLRGELDSLPSVQGWFQFLADVLHSAHSREDVVATLRKAIPDHGEARIQAAAELFYDLAPDMIDVMRNNQIFEGSDIDQWLERITCPTLIIAGDWEHGGVMRSEDIDYAREHLHGATRIAQLPGVGHNLIPEHAETVLGHMLDFLQTL